MNARKFLFVTLLTFAVVASANANSWDKYVTKKTSGNNATTANTAKQNVAPTSVSKPKLASKPIAERNDKAPVYQPEIVAPYQQHNATVSQQTREQAEQQLQRQQAQYQQADQWEDYSNSYYDNSSVGYNKTYSQWFDNDIRPVYYFRGGLMEETQFGNYGVTEIAIADFKARLFTITDFLPGASVDAWLFADGMYFIDNPGISALPDALLAGGLDMGLWWRFTNGFSWELRGAPGIYSDPTAPEFSCTGTLNLHYTFSETLCFVVGATYRPEWDMEIYPNIGLIWQPSDLLRVHAALPESRVDLFPRHILNFFATFAWDNTTYWLDNEESLPGTVTFDAMRASVGATMTLFDNLELSAEIGTHLKHELKGDVKGEDSIDLDKTTFIRASIGNRF